MRPRNRDTGPDRATRELVWARCGGLCERCCGPAHDIHHRRPRGMGGTRDPRVNSTANLVALCRGCHELIEARREWARGQGWLISRAAGADPGSIPVVTGLHGRVYFDGDGSVSPSIGPSAPPL